MIGYFWEDKEQKSVKNIIFSKLVINWKLFSKDMLILRKKPKIKWEEAYYLMVGVFLVELVTILKRGRSMHVDFGK